MPRTKGDTPDVEVFRSKLTNEHNASLTVTMPDGQKVKLSPYDILRITPKDASDNPNAKSSEVFQGDLSKLPEGFSAEGVNPEDAYGAVIEAFDEIRQEAPELFSTQEHTDPQDDPTGEVSRRLGRPANQIFDPKLEIFSHITNVFRPRDFTRMPQELNSELNPLESHIVYPGFGPEVRAVLPDGTLYKGKWFDMVEKILRVGNAREVKLRIPLGKLVQDTENGYFSL